MIPAFFSALQDRLLRGNPREVYQWCHEHLDIVEYRPVKHSAIQTSLGLADASVHRAMKRLVERRYIDVGPRDGRIITYRLFYSRALD